MNRTISNRLRLWLSVGFGIIIMILVWDYIRRAENRLNARYETTTVLVARKYIPLGKEIVPELLEEKKVPIVFLQPTALTKWGDLKGTKGDFPLKARIGLLKGEQITTSKLIEGGGLLTLAWTLAPDQVAVSLRLSPDQAVGGHLRPGDWVSIYSTFERQPGLSEAENNLILSRSQIVGIQGLLLDPNGGSFEKIEWKDLSNDFILVTLSVHPDQVGRLMLASEKGRLSLALLSALNMASPHSPPTKLSQMVRS